MPRSSALASPAVHDRTADPAPDRTGPAGGSRGAGDHPGPPLRALLRHYRAAGDPVTCEPVTLGLLNRGYRLTTTRGVYFLKHHLDGDREAIGRQHRAVLGLQTFDVPVAPPVAADDGSTCALLGGHCYALHPWIDGTHRDGAQLTVGASWRLGGLLGLVHTCLDQVMEYGRGPAPGSPTTRRSAPQRPGSRLPAPQRHGTPIPSARLPAAGDPAAGDPAAEDATGRPSPDGPGCGGPGRAQAGPYESRDPALTFQEISELLALARGHRPGDSFDELAAHRLQERRALLERHAHRRPPPGAEPAPGWVHGDFHPLNLLYRGVEPAAIVDWDRLAVQPRAEEAVRAAAIFFVRPTGELALRKVRAYATAYRRAAGADARELAAAVHRVWWERLNDFWILRWRYLRHDRRADPQFAAVSALAVWWTKEYEAVRDAFTG